MMVYVEKVSIVLRFEHTGLPMKRGFVSLTRTYQCAECEVCAHCQRLSPSHGLPTALFLVLYHHSRTMPYMR